MTVKEVFDLRKQGRIEEAYEAIRPMYAAHKGRYTTLCMFWTAADVFKLRLEQKRYDEAEKILEALKRMLPRVEEITKQLDSERPTSNPTEKPVEKKKPLPWEKGEAKTADDQNKASAFIASATRRLAKAQKTEKKSSPVRATDHSCGSNSTVPETTSAHSVLIDSVDEKNNNPSRSVLTGSPGEKTDSPSRSVLTGSPGEKTDSPSRSVPTGSTGEKEAPTNSQLLHDYPGRLIVSLDEGIIRPIDGINAPQRVVLACITAHSGYNVPQISASTGIPAKSIERHISALIDKNLIEHQGSKKTGGYYLTHEGTDFSTAE